jgi:hypothetical protein
MTHAHEPFESAQPDMTVAVPSGLRVLTTMLEEDRTAICRNQPDQPASRVGTAPSEVV